MKKSLALLLVVFMVMALYACAPAPAPKEDTPTAPSNPAPAPAANDPAPAVDTPAQVKTLRLAASDPASYPLCMADTFFAEKLAELSGGTLKVETHFDGVLGEEADTVESLGLGMLELTRVSAGNMSTFVPELELFNLPFLFTGAEHFNAVITGECADIYAGLFEKAGFKLISFYAEGTRYIFNKKECVITPEQLKGVKIRTMGAQSIQDGFTAMGASPTPMSSGEVYTALSQGILDACENNYSTIYANKLYESAKYFSNTAHLRVPSVMLCSLDYWNSLSAEEQSMVQEAAADTFDFAEEVFDKSELEAFDAMIAEGCVYTELTDDQRAAFAALCTDVYQKYATNEVSQNILNVINSLA